MNKQIAVYDNSVSARTYLSYIAEQAGGFACIGRDGKLYIKTIGQDSAELPIKYFQNFKWGEKFKISRIRYEDGIQLFENGDETNNTVYINQDNMYIVDQEQIDNIYNQLKGLEVYSFEGDSIIDPALDVGDILIIDGKKVIYQGFSQYGGKFKASISSKIQCKAKEETMVRIPSQKTINRRVQSQINEAKGEITQLITETAEIKEEVNNITTTTWEAEGKDIHIEDSADEPLVYIRLYGESSQKTRSGKNKLDLSKIEVAENKVALNSTGLDIKDCWAQRIMTNEDVVKDFKANTRYICTAKVKVLSKPTTMPSQNHNNILLLYNSNTSVQRPILFDENKNDWEAGKTYSVESAFLTPSDLTDFRLVCYNYYGNSDGSTTYMGSGEFEITELMLREATVEDDTFELYGVSPSPKFPSMIENIEGDIEVKVTGKNKFDRDKVITDKPNNIALNATGITITNCWAQIIMTNENVLKDFKPNTRYTCIAKVKCVSKPTTLKDGTNHDNILLLYNSNATAHSQQKSVLFDENKNGWVVGTTYNCRKVFTTPEDLIGYKLIAYNYYGNSDGSTTYMGSGEFEITELMILEGDVTDEDFELYKSQAETFSMDEGEKIYKASYLADDGKHHARKQTVFNGAEEWQLRMTNEKTGVTTYSVTNVLSPYKKNSEVNALSNYFNYLGALNGVTEVNKLDVGFALYYNSSSSGQSNIIYINSEISTLDAFKFDLETKYINGTPVTIEYELGTEEIIPYTEEQQEQWNKIKALMTYKNVTNIISDAYAKITYMRDNGLGVYETKQNADKRYTETNEKLVEQKLTTDGITNAVSDTIKRLDNDYLTAEQVNAEIDTAKEDINILKQSQAKTELTSEQFRIEIDRINNEGVTKVKTSMGYTFDDKGASVDKEGADTGTIIDEAGFKVLDKTGINNGNLLYAGYVKEGDTSYPDYIGQTIVATANMIIERYLVLGANARIEDYVNPHVGGEGTGAFKR